MKYFILNISHYLFPCLITFTIYNKAQHLGGFLYIGIEMPISFYLECNVGMEFN